MKQRYTCYSAVWGMSHTLNRTGPVEHLPTDAMGSPINSSDPKAASYWGNPTLRCLPKSLSLGEWYFTPLQVEEMKPLTCSVLDASRSLVISWCADTTMPRWVHWLPTKWDMQETAANPHAAAQHIRCPTSGHDEPDNTEQHLCFAGSNLYHHNMYPQFRQQFLYVKPNIFLKHWQWS